jgi:hypothetical protein
LLDGRAHFRLVRKGGTKSDRGTADSIVSARYISTGGLLNAVEEQPIGAHFCAHGYPDDWHTTLERGARRLEYSIHAPAWGARK